MATNTSILAAFERMWQHIIARLAYKAEAEHSHDDRYDEKGAAAAVKNDLLNGAGAAYDTLKELGELIDDNQDAIEALETVASNKANKDHPHAIKDVTDLQTQLNAKVPTTRTVNGKALSANITLSASDVGADASGSASSALFSAKTYTDTAVAQKSQVQIITWEADD